MQKKQKQTKNKRCLKKQCKHHGPDSETEILKLLGWEFKITMINMLKTLMEKVHNMQEQKGKKSREMESLTKD